jgi:D-3-phosphoglycerate dehydrogenase
VRFTVIQTEELDDSAASWLSERCELVRAGPDDPRFESLIRRAQGLVVRTYTLVDEAMLEKAPMLRGVARAGVGLERIDVDACERRGVRVVHTPEANTQAVAEYVFALLFDALRPRAFLEKPLEERDWRQLRSDLRARRQLSDCTLGIVGMGKIGRRVAEIARAIRMRVIYHDLQEIPAALRAGAEPVSMDELLTRSDVISLHVDARPGNRNLINSAAFSRMRSDVVLVNTCRGFVIEPYACAEFFISHPGATALLDVHEPEPFDGRYPLLEIANVHLAPHIAAATSSANRAMSWVVRDLWRVLIGEVPEYVWSPAARVG